MNRLLQFSWVILIALLFQSCFEYEDVDFKGMESYKVEEQNGDHVVVRLDLRVHNPNKYNITIKKTKLDVSINGKKIGQTEMKDDIKLKKKTEAVYPVRLKMNKGDIMRGAMSSLGGLFGGSVKVGVKGNVKAKAYGIGKKFPLEFEEPVNMKDFMK